MAALIADVFSNPVHKDVDDVSLPFEANGVKLTGPSAPFYDNFGPDLVTLIIDATKAMAHSRVSRKAHADARRSLRHQPK
ncbi:hypothetical protein ERN12_13145 [Rhodobacteraceae bacterium]|nr:hypothetical protein ERN12_13145 [Paracoccaceae bacterium]